MKSSEDLYSVAVQFSWTFFSFRLSDEVIFAQGTIEHRPFDIGYHAKGPLPIYLENPTLSATGYALMIEMDF
jgi:hypothetical protein